MKDFKEVALRVAQEVNYLRRGLVDYTVAEEFAKRLLAELKKGAVPVAWMNSRNGFICKENKNQEYNIALFTHSQPKAATVPEGFAALYEECFQHVFKVYATPRDKFSDDEQWALFCYRQVYDNLEKFQRLRAMLSAAPSLPAQSEGEQK